MTTPAPHMLGPNFQDLNRLEADTEIALQQQILHVLRLLRPMEARGFAKARFGSAGSGGYVYLDDFAGIDTAISLGIDRDISCDLALAARGLEVQQFDQASDDPAPGDPRLNFHRTMISPAAGEGRDTLEAIVRRWDKGSARPNMILRMNIADWEWPVLEATQLDEICRFAQVSCELHNFEAIGDLRWRQLFFRGLRKLSKFYVPIHVHANNWAPLSVVANVAIPNVIRVTFANRAQYAFEETEERFPGPLDAPCNPDRPDILLGSFRY